MELFPSVDKGRSGDLNGGESNHRTVPVAMAVSMDLKPVRQKFSGALLVIAATVLFASHDAVSKHLMLFFAVPLLIWVRYILYVVFMLVGVAPRMGRELFVTGRPRLMVLRALMLVGVSVFFQNAVKALPLAEATALTFITPLLVALLSGPMLHEKVPLKAWLVTATGFCGVLLICRPGSAMNLPGVAYALASSLCYAYYQILTRKLAASEPPMRQLFYTAIVGAAVLSLVVPAYWTGTLPTPAEGLLIVWLGLAAGIGQFLLIHAFQITTASSVSPMLYFQLVWAMLFGWAIFGQLPDLLTTAGMLVIGASCLSLVMHQPRVQAELEIDHTP
jgi:drug/metabolite transporter (DMT)-like permease